MWVKARGLCLFAAILALLLGCSLPLLSSSGEEAESTAVEAEDTFAPPAGEGTVASTGGVFTYPTAEEGFPADCPTYPSDFSFIEVPEPLSGDNPLNPLVERPMPAVGECYLDEQFGSVLRRVTEDQGVNGRHEYSRHDPFNTNQTLILLVTDEGSFRLYRTNPLPYNQPDNLVMEISQTEPRWDPRDPYLLWAIQDFSIVNVHVDTGEVNVVKDFSQDAILGPLIAMGDSYRVTMMDEGEPSLDRRWWALSLQGNERADYRHLYLFTWDRDTDSIACVYPQGRPLEANEAEIDWVSMSPLGNWVIIGGMESNAGQTAGLVMASPNFGTFHRLDYTTSHADVGLDTDGNEVVVMQSYQTDTIDLIPIDLSTQPVLEAGGSEEGTGRVPLIRLYYAADEPIGLNSGVHISCNTPGYCFISTTIAAGLAEQNWLDRSLVLVHLERENPRVFYLTKLHSTISEEPRVYWDETQGSMTVDGSRLVWVENWGENVGEESFFLIQMIMPENWRELSGETP